MLGLPTVGSSIAYLTPGRFQRFVEFWGRGMFVRSGWHWHVVYPGILPKNTLVVITRYHPSCTMTVKGPWELLVLKCCSSTLLTKQRRKVGISSNGALREATPHHLFDHGDIVRCYNFLPFSCILPYLHSRLTLLPLRSPTREDQSLLTCLSTVLLLFDLPSSVVDFPTGLSSPLTISLMIVTL